jgi:carboxylesterase type B
MIVAAAVSLQVQSDSRCRFVIPSLLIAMVLLTPGAKAQSINDWMTANCSMINDVKYSGDEKNSFDILMPRSDTPTPLVIYIHGGGFVGGDKTDAFRSRREDITYMLENNVAFASLNYRFRRTDDSLGVAACLNDVRTALQYIRHHAGRYNIIKERIACYGSSAGAGSSLYLAFHDDLARKNDTTILGESTRIQCVGALATQATYDVFQWIAYIPGLDTAVERAKEPTFDVAAKFYGYPNYLAFEPHREAITRELDMLQMISPDDPPAYIMNLQKETVPKDMNTIQHHRAHALVLSECLERNRVEHEVYLFSDVTSSEQDIPHPVREFLVGHLK